MKYGEAMAYIPERSDIVWIMFNPQAGHEQAGRRPALVLSLKAYDGKVGLAILCSILLINFLASSFIGFRVFSTPAPPPVTLTDRRHPKQEKHV
jgi:mRNA-degrading endonuclease toxin of MazEF toxin-antitoxin module